MAKKTVLRKRGRVTVDGYTVPVTVFFERRNNARVSAGKDSVLLRIPARSTDQQLNEYKQWCSRWIKKQWQSSERFRAAYMPFDVQRCKTIHTTDRDFSLRISEAESKMAKGVVDGNQFLLKIPSDWTENAKSDALYRMIHNLLARTYLAAFERRVIAMHAEGGFSKKIKSIALRNMSSRWGSCSQYGELSFSTKLLFAPRSVQDYVILHELCHLDVLDHSDRFWKRVQNFDPHYLRKERWLDENGHLCDIKHQSGRMRA